MQRLQTRTVVLIISSLYIIQCISFMRNSMALTREPGPPQRHCVVVLEQDTMSSASYWFNPGRPVRTLLKNVDCVIKQNQNKETNK